MLPRVFEAARQGGTDTARWPVRPRRPSREAPPSVRIAQRVRIWVLGRGSCRWFRFILVDVVLPVEARRDRERAGEFHLGPGNTSGAGTVAADASSGDPRGRPPKQIAQFATNLTRRTR